jgi:hydroxymethylpyrimidine/phosphomethylpyrimidine kinase
MNYFRIIIIVLCSNILSASFTMENDHNQMLKKSVIATYCGTLIAEALLLVPEVQAFVFGNQSVSSETMDTIAASAKALKLDAVAVKTGHSWWRSSLFKSWYFIYREFH